MRYRLLLLFFLCTTSLSAQVVGPINSRFNSIRQNGVSTVAVTGDTVWISPALNRNINNSPDWIYPSGLDSIDNGIGRAFSIAVNNDTVFAGLGFSSVTELAGTVPAAYGYYISTDGGDNWYFSDFLLDNRIDADTTFVYGGTTYNRKRIIVPEQSPPYSVAFRGDVLFSANWASGLLRSTDLGRSWERVVLPPFGESLLTPTRNDYYWINCLEVENGSCVEDENVYDSVEDDNLKGFAVFVDSEDRVWFGSAGGINISENALTAPIDSIEWRNVNFNADPNGLLARWIIEIDEDTTTNRVWMTNWLAESSNSIYAGMDRYGLVFTEDGGQTFEQRLVGEKINALTFKDGYVFAAGESGLFISRNGGDSWYKSPRIKSPNQILKESVQFEGAGAGSDRVWIGTTDGIISTNDLGNTWEITRLNFPLSGGNSFDPEARSVDTYAYPNPFSPYEHDIVRIKFNVSEPGNVKVRVFDFGMNLIRELENSSFTSGDYEALWDGYDDHNRKVANGTYIYLIESSGKTVNGKILVVD